MARAICFINIEDLNPHGRIFYPELSKSLVSDFRFQKSPSGLWELDLQQGITFEDGKVGDFVVQKFSIFRNGFVLDTLSSTTDSEKALMDILAWGVEKFGVNYHPGMIRRTAHYSQVVAYLDLPLDWLNPVLYRTATRVSEFLQLNPRIPYETSSITLAFDPTLTTLAPGNFTIEKRTGSPFSENRYFCGAPLRTEQHLALLEEFETGVLSQIPKDVLPKARGSSFGDEEGRKIDLEKED
jgi:hypothetical protein